uniref:Quinone oxidoreductase-like protein 2 homolog n=1 Tax=Cacopsylla melanoneura TaxID=428564 RepID=A0A8D9BDV4_9HEMI
MSVAPFLQGFAKILRTHSKLCCRKFSVGSVCNDKIRSAVLTGVNKPLEIKEESPVPLKEGQVRIDIQCCALNTSDLFLWNGSGESKPTLPLVPGFEFSGTIVEIADSKSSSAENEADDDDDSDVLQVGDKVLALNKELLHGFSDQCVLHRDDVFKVPEKMTFEHAASLADSYSTAHIVFSRHAKLKEKQTVLVTAAGGGLGIAAVDMATKIYKAKVIGVCNSEDKTDLIRQKGAWAALTFTNEKSLVKKVLEVSGGKYANVVFEAVGGEVFKAAMHCVGHEGKLIVAGFSSKVIPEVYMGELLQLPSISLIGVSLGNYRKHAPRIYRNVVKNVIKLYEEQNLVPHICDRFPLERVNEALTLLDSGSTSGKIVINIKQ